MTIENLIQYILSFLGGGLVVAIFNWWRISVNDKKKRKAEYLLLQMERLYGPLNFFTLQNEQMFLLSDKFNEAYDVEYIKPKWSNDEQTQKDLKEETTVTLDLANSYVKTAINNNDKIIEILENNYSYVDLDDIEIFHDFVVDYTRLKNEINEGGKLLTPYRIYNRIGNISLIKKDFIERVKDKFKEKSLELKKYQSK